MTEHTSLLILLLVGWVPILILLVALLPSLPPFLLLDDFEAAVHAGYVGLVDDVVPGDLGRGEREGGKEGGREGDVSKDER